MRKTAEKFKVGQTVELVANSGMVAELGATAIVKRLYDYNNTSLIKVVWKTGFGHQMNGGYESYRFKPFFRKNEQLLFEFME